MNRRAELGMAMFLISEAVFFFLLILACVYFRALPRLYAPSGWILTAVLLSASASIWRKWRWVALALGVLFLVGMVTTPFAMLTAVLGLFVFAGVIALAFGPVSSQPALSLYWYFFTAVWLVIFGISGQV